MTRLKVAAGIRDPAGFADRQDAVDALRVAIGSRNTAAVVAMVASDVVLHSPVSPTPFRGRDVFAKTFEGLMAGSEKWADDWHVERVLIDGDLCQITFGGRLRGQTVSLISTARFDEQHVITEIRTYGRPMTAIAAIPFSVLPPIAGLRSRTRAVAAALLTWPLARPMQLLVSVGMWIGKPWPHQNAPEARR